MEKVNINKKYFLKNLEEVLSVDSTTGFNDGIIELMSKKISELGFKYEVTHKGGIIVTLGGEGNPVCVTSHMDTIGLMVRHINQDGTLKVCNVGGLYPFYSVTENVRVYTRDGKVYTGNVSRNPNSIHVTENELRGTLADFDTNVCIVLDEDVKTKEDTEKLGIEVGDYVNLEPRFCVENDYIKSRFLDDKASVAIMLAFMKHIKDNNIKLNRKVYFYFACYEEIGHGTTYLPNDVKDILAVDIAPMGDNQTSDEKKVSIFAKDSRFPYNYNYTNELREIAKEHKLNFCLDIFTPHYGSDADGSVMAGYDIRWGAIGFGTRNSHGYERTHLDGINETYKLLYYYLLK